MHAFTQNAPFNSIHADQTNPPRARANQAQTRKLTTFSRQTQPAGEPDL